MPEYQVTMEVNFYANDEADASEVSLDLASLLFEDEDVNSVGAGIPIHVKDDDA